MLIEAIRNEHRTTVSGDYVGASTFPNVGDSHPPPLRGPPPSREDLRSGSSGAKHSIRARTSTLMEFNYLTHG